MKTLAELKHMTFIPHHECSICGAFIGWDPQEPNPFFDPSCDCGSGGGHYETWENVFKFYNNVFEKETEEAVQAAWNQEAMALEKEKQTTQYVRSELEEFRQEVSRQLNMLLCRIDDCVDKNRVDSIELILSRIDNELQSFRYNKAVLEILKNHKSNWIADSKGGEPNHR